jgi:hypothetical protein
MKKVEWFCGTGGVFNGDDIKAIGDLNQKETVIPLKDIERLERVIKCQSPNLKQ